jgi:hypothetical protein
MNDVDGKAALSALAALGLAPGADPLPLEGLTLTLTPREEGLAEKDVPVEALFHKITMMRDKLRVLEQRINAADGLSTVERARLQAEITATYEACTGLLSFFSTTALAAPALDDVDAAAGRTA